jgi:RNA polymerase sigma-70 factor (ECF subfamily)
VILAAGTIDSPDANAALEILCRSYWTPVYAWIRRQGRLPEDACDLTQSFFARLIERNTVALVNRDRGRFRAFLLTALQHFLTNEYHRGIALKRGGGRETISLDALDPEARAAIEPAGTETPETAFDRRWARVLVEQALDALRGDYAASGRAALFDLLKGYVWGEKSAATCAEIASELELNQEAVKKALQRLRLRFAEKLRSEIARTVSSPSDIDAELRHLAAALRGG